MRPSYAFAAALALLAACGGPEENAGVTAGESDRLNETAEMLDASPDSLVAGEEQPLGNGEAPAETGDVLVADNAVTNGY